VSQRCSRRSSSSPGSSIRQVAVDYTRLREAMVRKHLLARGLQDPRMLEAFGKVPRERFLKGSLKAHAYEDRPLPIGEGQ
jgi:protein-L-isoaspartate(D-aspartate) O-methyltransferase